MEGLVLNIQKFCINDGPGIRTTVFLKGCSLHCAWCHNPESHFNHVEILYDSSKCIGCGRCAEACKNNAHIFEAGKHIYNRSNCIKCGNCVNACCQNAFEVAGRYMSVSEVMRQVLKDKVFYDDSGGGLTLSGGEPLLQFDFSYELMKAAKQNNLHTCMETCGFSETEKLLDIAKFIDIFLYDFKLTNDELHKKYTGVSNKLILRNLKAIDAAGAKTILKCPIIPGVNDSEDHFLGIAELAGSLENVLGIEIEPYHSMGNSKYEKLGKSCSAQIFEKPDEYRVNQWIEQIQKHICITVKKA